MRDGFTPISLADYVERHLSSNPGTDRADLIHRLKATAAAHRRGQRCRCGSPIWIIGSAEVGLSCFTCITGEYSPDQDYEIDLKTVDLPQANPGVGARRRQQSRFSRSGRP